MKRNTPTYSTRPLEPKIDQNSKRKETYRPISAMKTYPEQNVPPEFRNIERKYLAQVGPWLV